MKYDADYQLEGMTIAVTHMQNMINFYRAVFNIEFTESQMGDFTLYQGQWGKLKLLLCPAELAGNTAVQNRHQLDIIVPNLEKSMNTALAHGGKSMGEIAISKDLKSVGIYDPDNNSLVFKELLH